MLCLKVGSGEMRLYMVAGNGSIIFYQIYFMAIGLKEKVGEEVRHEDEICLFGSSCYI